LLIYVKRYHLVMIDIIDDRQQKSVLLSSTYQDPVRMLDLRKLYFKVNDYSNPNYIGSRFRKKRFRFFEDKIKNLQKPLTILDIGGTVRFWVNEGYQKKDVLITILNLRPDHSEYANISVIGGDACDLSMFKDNTFDIAFSNSLIEHLYTKENQVKMAHEAMRVAHYFFIQTPNRYFPIEPHFKFPFFQFLPKSMQIFLQTKTSLINGSKYSKEYAENVLNEIRLLSKEEMLNIFPRCNLYTEQFLGLSKSFIAHSFPA
jgi:predicted SAM-dependent methyltransferase